MAICYSLFAVRTGGQNGSCGVAALLMLLAVVFAALAIRSLPAARERKANAVVGSAAITEIRTHYRKPNRRIDLLYSYWYAFTVDGRAYRGVWNADTDSSHRTGEIIPISYLRSHPSDNNYGGTLNDAPYQSPSIEFTIAAILVGMSFLLFRNK
jgi:hypothetical protein